MPARLPWSKSNKSQASVGSVTDRSDSPSSRTSFVAASPSAPRLTRSSERAPDEHHQPLQHPQTFAQLPTGQRPPSILSIDRLAINPAAAEASTPIDPPTDLYAQYIPQTPNSVAAAKEKRSFRSKLGLGHSSRDSIESSSSKTGALGRKVSVRKKEVPTPRGRGTSDDQKYYWSSKQGSNPQLPPSHEVEEEPPQLDSFLRAHTDQPSPSVPPKDDYYNQTLAHAPEPSRYSRPSLARVQTDQTFRSHNPSGRSSPHLREGHSGLSSQQQQNYSQDQHYQAFTPKSIENPAGFHSQQPDPIAQQDLHNHQQHQQQPQQGRPGVPASRQQQDQDLQFIHPPQVQQPEILSPQPVRAIVPQTQQLQQSPLASSQQQQSLTPQLKQEVSITPLSEHPPPTPTNQMSPAAQHGKRSTDSTRQNMPPKESSGSQQQGQGQNVSTTGHQTFGANVVPSGSQGQPFRGGKQQDNESGRGTPPPSSAAGEMTEEEILQLRKEHDVLREKYQKVKRYFFEQQSQVHQLQNTIAHQRLSQSRTSLDDSEYSSRFNRLDGLISQLAFVIRKDWKSIPDWLHRAVNRDAVTIGKQEMTAVGRAFISNWLVDEIFNKYFHPDLETNLSMQLKVINTNIRKSAPLAQTSDEEDALTAKVVNWRLATLDGLGEHLRAPQAQTNRESLIAILNEKLIGTLQMYLKEPAPPDLQSNVPMIIELAINIAVHLPLESRDVCIEYYPPGHGIMGEQMKIESGVPALTAPLAEGLLGGPGKDDAASVASATSLGGDGSGNGASKVGEMDIEADSPQSIQSQSVPQQESKRSTGRNMFSGLMGGKPKAATMPQQQQLGAGKAGGAGSSQVSLSAPAKEEQPPRVRIAAGVSVRIWGRTVLVKAPVFPTS